MSAAPSIEAHAGEAPRAGLKLLVWMNMPSHHQCAFFAALRAAGVDLVVHYFDRVSPDRVRLGWSESPELPSGERFVLPDLASLELCPDWQQRVHIVPGYSLAFLRRLAAELSAAAIPWLHWSEPSRAGWRWWLRLPHKRSYASLVNRHALGALAIGELARRDFQRWGMRPELIRLLPYGIEPLIPSGDGRPAAGRSRSRDVTRFLYLGSLYHLKGVDLLIKAFVAAAGVQKSARLDLVGHDRSRGGYRRLTERLGVAASIQVHDSVPAAQIARVIEQCDVLVLPSRHDGWGVVLNEAASLSKALIATDACGAAHHLIEDGWNGYRVAAGSPAALAAAMARYIADPELARVHGARSQRLCGDFAPNAAARRLADAIESLRSRNSK